MAQDILIGFDGWGDSGKTFAAEILAEYGFVTVDLAEPLKEMLVDIGFPVQHWDEDGNDTITEIGQYVEEHGWEEAKKSPEVRSALQGAGRWVRKMAVAGDAALMKFFEDGARKRGDAQLLSVGNHYAITNARMAAEKERIRELGGCIIRINRDGIEPAGDDITEKREGGFEFEVDNNGDRESLRAQLVECVEQWYPGLKLVRKVPALTEDDPVEDGTDPLYEDGTEVEP